MASPQTDRNSSVSLIPARPTASTTMSTGTPASYIASTSTVADGPDEQGISQIASLSNSVRAQKFLSNRSILNSSTVVSPKLENDGIYKATYSGVPVFEMQANGVSVMRRQHDSSLNATQILKVAGVDKSKRTKILEKEILTGVHEKVQGGYGKYQGTWITYERAVDLCKQYSVYDVLYPLLSFDSNNTGMENTPTKEQAMAAKRKRLAHEFYTSKDSLAGRTTSNEPSPTPAIGPGGHASMMSFARPLQVSSNSVPLATSASAALSSLKVGLSPNTTTDIYTESLAKATRVEKNDMNERQKSTNGKHHRESDTENATAKRAKTEKSPPVLDDVLDDEAVPEPTTPLEPIPENTPNFEASRELMTHIFMENGAEGAESLLQLLGGPRKLNIDVAIDESGHTALHWASALARIPLVRNLVKKGASCRMTNYAGETPLTRAVLVTNNSESSTFSELLDNLYPAIPIADKQGRTLLHHISLVAGIRGRSDASRYYLETLLEWVVRRGSKSKTGRFGLSWLMKEVVNRQDNNGDTALNIAARVGNKQIAQQLLDVGGDPSLTNRAGLCPLDFGVQTLSRNTTIANHVPVSTVRSVSTKELVTADSKSRSEAESTGTKANISNREKRLNIVKQIENAIRKVEANFEQEISEKKSLLETMRGQLRSASTLLTEKKQRLMHLKSISRQLAEWQQSSQSLERAVEEEDQRFKQKTIEASKEKSEKQTDRSKSEDADIIPKKEPGETSAISEPTDKSSLAAAAAAAAALAGSTGQNVPTDVSLSFEGNFDADQPFRLWSGNQEQLAKIPTAVLKARCVAYKQNEENLLKISADLRGRSAELEKKFRRVISLCTGVEESKVDGILKGLVKAVESDPGDVDISRVAGFLRKVDEGGDPQV